MQGVSDTVGLLPEVSDTARAGVDAQSGIHYGAAPASDSAKAICAGRQQECRS